MRFVCVLRSGGDYGSQHVGRLRRQLQAVHPAARLLCLSDIAMPDVLPLQYDWPGWWSKMELFRPDLNGDLLFMDLDSAITGDLSDLMEVDRLAIMRDVYRPAGLQSSLMFLPQRDRAAVWEKWISQPEKWMRQFRRGGDQAFLETLWLGRGVALWQNLLPGQVVSWKVDVRPQGRLPENARFVAFHGRPRPWEVGW